MRVFQLGNDLGFRFEAANEVRLIRIRGQDNFYGNFPINNRLVGAVNFPEAAFANLARELEERGKT